MSAHHKVVIIGAGVSGLVTLKTLSQLGIDCVLYEANDYHGGLWHFHPDNYGVMDFTYINVSHWNYAFSDFPFPDGPDYAHHTAISKYIDSYVQHFKLNEHIHYKTKVIDAAKTNDWSSEKKWRVLCLTDTSEFTVTCEYLVVATGHHAKPKLPTFPGEEKFKGEIVHSVKYKDVWSSGFEKKNVVIIGMGNSAMDIADNLVGKGGCTEVKLSARNPQWVYPNYFLGNPVELHGSRLSVGASPLVKNFLGKLIISFASGHPTRWGLNPKYGPADTHPSISPTIIHHIQRGHVKVVPNVKEIGSDHVVFDDESQAEDVDVIIKCTGYLIDLSFLSDDVRQIVLDEENNELKMFQTVFSPEIGANLALIGYIQPIGGLITISEIQAQWLGQLIIGSCALPSKVDMKEKIIMDKKAQSHYNKSTRHTIQRDPILYCDEISSYFGAKPSMMDHIKIAHRLLIGSGGVAQWTLQGPYKNPAAVDMVKKVPIPAFNYYTNAIVLGLFMYFIYVVFKILAYILF